MGTSSETSGGAFDIDSARTSYQERRIARRQTRYELWALARGDADKIIAGIRERWHPNRIVIWGSLLKPDRFTENSDIDIAVEGVNDMERWSEMEAWALGQTDIALDLIPLEKAHPEHRSRILETGSVVYEREKRHG